MCFYFDEIEFRHICEKQLWPPVTVFFFLRFDKVANAYAIRQCFFSQPFLAWAHSTNYSSINSGVSQNELWWFTKFRWVNCILKANQNWCQIGVTNWLCKLVFLDTSLAKHQFSHLFFCFSKLFYCNLCGFNISVAFIYLYSFIFRVSVFLSVFSYWISFSWRKRHVNMSTCCK